MNDMTATYKSYIVPAGKYWLGDPCYVIRSNDWLQFCNEYSWQEDKDNSSVTLENGINVLAFSTYYGDGCYNDQHGNEFSVDAGLIGLVPHEYLENDFESNSTTYAHLGTVVEFSEDTLCFTVDGILTFGNHIIDTK